MTLTPLESTFEITTVAGCRVGCKACPQEVFLKVYDGPRVLSLAMFKTCVDKIPDWVQIDFSGFSEPYLNWWCAEMIEYAAQRHAIYVYTTMVGMTEGEARRLTAVQPKHLGIHIRDVEDRSPIVHADLNLIKFLRPQEFITHADPHPSVVPYLPAGVRVSRCRLNSRGSNLHAVPRRHGPLQCSSTRRFRHNVMLPDGTVVLCCMDYGMKHVLGNLLTDSYESLFEYEYRRILAAAHSEDGDLLCRGCDISMGR